MPYQHLRPLIMELNLTALSIGITAALHLCASGNFTAPFCSEFNSISTATGNIAESSNLGKLLSALQVRAADESSSCPNSSNCRAVQDIIWSCLATIFACTWVSLHPNVPGKDDSEWTIAFARLKLMILALIAPEAIILWAMRQWLVARRAFKYHGLSMTHGFFLSMGGFRRGSRILTVQLIRSEPHIIRDIGAIPIKEIADRSKGDALTKGFAILQTSWFVVQCIARVAQRLPITELEIATLAFASLNIVIYLFWWNKPLDVRCSISVGSDVETTASRVDSDAQSTASIIPASEIEAAPSHADGDADIEETVVQIDDGVEKEVEKEVSRIDAKPPRRTWSMLMRSLLMMPVTTYIQHSSHAMESGFVLPKHAPRVPLLWAENIGKVDIVSGLMTGAVAACLAAVFGAIHCVAWSFSFPSPQEQLVWRVASAIVTGAPVVLVLCYGSLFNPTKGYSPPTVWLPYFVGRIYTAVIIPFCIILYTLARVVLLVQMFVSLRDLTADAYQTVDWVAFIPHI